MTTTLTPPSPPKTMRSILDLPHGEARKFLLRPESYCNVDLPSYIQLGPLLDSVQDALGDGNLSDLGTTPREHHSVNHSILTNKDGKYSWRPLELIHPALYISLVQHLTSEDNWGFVTERFKEFSTNTRVRCLSLPVLPGSGEKGKAAQIRQWWSSVEQKSIELSLEYQHLIDADITDCYGSIYTHSIAWALHGKQFAKDNRRSNRLLGNVIDGHIQDMRYGQTNGIPQGSVLMGFIAEMVLGFIDVELSEKIASARLDDYQILRYRDDYRIFTNNPNCGAHIVKLLTETVMLVGLKLNAAKTRSSSEVVRSSVKADKLAWLNRKQSERDLQKHLLIIHDHANQFPNAGSLVTGLGEYHKRVLRAKTIRQPVALIAIVADIAFRNPRTHASCAAILSTLLSHVKSDAQKIVITNRIKSRFSQIPNTGLLQIWLQRVTYPFNKAIKYEEPLCSLVSEEGGQLWNSEWITAAKLKRAMNAKIVDGDQLSKLAPTISAEEIAIFTQRASIPYS